MPTILIKKSDTPGAAPTGSDLTNLAGGAEIAVNTADKRVFSMNSSSAIIELGTNPGSLTTADASATVFRSGSATITNLIATTATVSDLSATVSRAGSATITNLTATSASVTVLTSSSATVTNLIATTGSVSDLSATVSRIGSGTVTQLTSTSASITTLTATSASVTNLTATSLVLSNLSIASANVTTLTSGSATITNLLATSLTVSSGSTLNGGVVVNELGADVDFRIESDTDANAFFLDGANGNVGIGTSSPIAKLQVNSASSGASVTNLFLRNDVAAADGSAVRITLTGTSQGSRNSYIESIIPTGSAHDLSFGTNSSGNAPTERMRILGTGGIVFGNGNAEATPTNGLLRGTDGSGTDITGATLTIQGGRGTGSGAGGPIVFSTSAAGASGTTLRTATERMRITSAGELLVGGTTAIATIPAVTIYGSGSGSFGGAGTIALYRPDTTITVGEAFGRITFWGNDTTSNTPTTHAGIYAVASDTHAAGDNPTDVAFYTTPDATETIAEAGRITQAGSYVLKGGTTTAAAGVGIIFPATQVASANANSLDDYEEGSWTPAWAFSTSGSVTLATATGKYTKIGNVVHAHCFVSSSAISSPTGDATITGFPFSSATSSGAAIGLVRRFATAFGTNLRADIFGTTVSFYVSATDAVSVTYLQGSDFASGSGYNQIRFDIVYEV